MEVSTGVEMDPEPSEDWLALYHYRGQPGLPPIARQVLTSAPWQAFASIRDGGETIAIGRVAAAAGWAGLTAIEVAPGHRRRGLATVVTAALAAQAAAHGAGHLYLQVEDDNEPARTLYRRIGFSAHHDYHYRIAPGARAPIRPPAPDRRPAVVIGARAAVSAPGAQACPIGRTEEGTSAPADPGGSGHGRRRASAPGADTALTFRCRTPSRPEGLPCLLEPPVNVLRLEPGGDGADAYATDLADLAEQLIRGAGPAR
jgi:ribosomal protein S18 acetylase RimI-like enzyme